MVDPQAQGIAVQALSGCMFESDDGLPGVVFGRLEHGGGLSSSDAHTILTLEQGRNA